MKDNNNIAFEKALIGIGMPWQESNPQSFLNAFFNIDCIPNHAITMKITLHIKNNAMQCLKAQKSLHPGRIRTHDKRAPQSYNPEMCGNSAGLQIRQHLLLFRTQKVSAKDFMSSLAKLVLFEWNLFCSNGSFFVRMEFFWSNGSFFVRMEAFLFEWKLFCSNGSFFVRMEAFLFEWKLFFVRMDRRKLVLISFHRKLCT
jgi:hypothetical protein